MNPAKFVLAFKELTSYLRHDFPRIIGKTGEDFFKETFHKEGFTDKVFVHWEEVQRRKQEHQKLVLKRGKTRRSQKYSKSDRTRKILTGPSANLGESIRWESDYNSVTFETDVEYAQAHNEGTNNAGRGHKTKIPKRQFMGPSQVLSDELREELDQKIRSLFK